MFTWFGNNGIIMELFLLCEKKNRNVIKVVKSGFFKHAVSVCVLQVEPLMGFSSGLKV